MGSKFCSFNVYGGELAAVERLCPGLGIRAAAPGWITAACDDGDWDAMRKTARRLSKELSCPVLYTEYFDDDFVDFSVYRDGKRAARHVPAEYEGFPRVPGRPRAWGELFGLSPEAEKTLRTVFGETNPERSLRLLECVLGCPLWVDGEFLDDIELPDPAYLETYLAQKAAEKKIKNVTKLTLLDEQEGTFCYARRNTYPIFRQEAGDPKYWEDGSSRKSVWTVRNGKLERLFEAELPGSIASAYAGEDVFLALVHQICRDADGNPISSADSSFNYERRNRAYVFSKDGQLLDTQDFKVNENVPAGGFLDRDRLFLNGICRNIRTHTQEWALAGSRVYMLGQSGRLADGRLAVLYETEEHPELYLASFRPDGSERVVRELPRRRFESCLLAYRDGILLGHRRELICYDAFLKERWRMELWEKEDSFREMRLDEPSGMLCMDSYSLVLSIDLKQRQVRASRKFDEVGYCHLQDVLPGVGVVMLTGDAAIQVWDAGLTPVSRHRTKGAVIQTLPWNGNLCVVTDTDPVDDFRRVGDDFEFVRIKEGRLRLYELKK